MVDRYLQVRGTTKTSRDVDVRYGVKKDSSESSTKAWLEKMRTLFIRKGSGFSSRSVITGDAYTKVNQVGIPYEIAQRITFEERVSVHNMRYLQELVDNKLCLTYRDGSSTYSLREGSKGHTFLRPGQVVHRRIIDGDVVFINRPPTTHKHSLQALSVYVHDDHTVKINPLICGPLSADFDGDCVHLFYPQSLAAKAEVLELFSVEKQLLSSHSGNLNLQLTTDSLLSLKMIFKACFLDKSAAQQLAMFVSPDLPQPALLKVNCIRPYWTAHQIL
jgi:DNA-directed RNA polymerase-5 subunit 1